MQFKSLFKQKFVEKKIFIYKAKEHFHTNKMFSFVKLVTCILSIQLTKANEEAEVIRGNLIILFTRWRIR